MAFAQPVLIEGYAQNDTKKRFTCPNEIIDIITMYLRIGAIAKYRIFNKSTSGRKMIFNSDNNRQFMWYIGDVIRKDAFSYSVKGIDGSMYDISELRFIQKRITPTGQWKESQRQQIENEIAALKCLKHKNIQKMLAHDIDYKLKSLNLVFIAYEYAAGGQLFDVLYYREKLEPILARTWFHQLVNGISHIHEHGIIHRDIKPENLLLDFRYNLKVFSLYHHYNLQ